MGPVGGFQRLPGRFDPCRPTTEIEQQVVEAQGRRHPGVFGTKITTARDRHAIADTAARRILAARDRHREIEGGQIERFGHADLRRLLAGRRPRLTGFRVMTERLFDDIDQAPFVRLAVQNLTGIVPGLSRGPAGRLRNRAVSIQWIIGILHPVLGAGAQAGKPESQEGAIAHPATDPPIT